MNKSHWKVCLTYLYLYLWLAYFTNILLTNFDLSILFNVFIIFTWSSLYIQVLQMVMEWVYLFQWCLFTKYRFCWPLSAISFSYAWFFGEGWLGRRMSTRHWFYYFPFYHMHTNSIYKQAFSPMDANHFPFFQLAGEMSSLFISIWSIRLLVGVESKWPYHCRPHVHQRSLVSSYMRQHFKWVIKNYLQNQTQKQLINKILYCIDWS